MIHGKKAVVAALIVILVISTASSVYYISTSFTLVSQEQTISALQSTVSSLVSHPLTTTSTITTTVSPTITPGFPKVPWNGGVLSMTTADGCNGSICFSSGFDNAFVFTCRKAAATQDGCTAQINSTANPLVSYRVTVSY